MNNLKSINFAIKNYFRLLTGASLIAIIVFSSACSQKPPTFNEPPFPFEWRANGRHPDAGLEMRPDYKVGVGDTLQIEARRYEEFSGEAEVTPQGYIRMPYTMDKVMVNGLTLDEAEAKIKEAMQPYVRLQPRAFVTLKKPDSKFFYVMGEVGRPGKYAIGNEYIYVREAVARAGWPTRAAAMNRTLVVSSKPDRNAERKVDLKKIIYEGDLSENYKLEDGDVIWVPKNYIDHVVDTMMHWLRPLGVIVAYTGAASDIEDYEQDYENDQFGRGSNRANGYLGYRY